MRVVLLLICLVSFLLTGCHRPLHGGLSHQPGLSSKKRPKNVILMIGDGMGLSQITGGLYANHNQLFLTRFPVVGLHKNYPDDKEAGLITDSAAGATAFSCGVKTYNAAIGVGPDSLPRKTVLEAAEEKGLATGLVVTCNIQHATPGAFIAHVKHRERYEDIALDFLKTDIDLFIGGGKKYFDDRKDGRNLLDELRAKGYYINDWTQAELDTLRFPDRNVGFLTANVQPLMASQGRDYLPGAAAKACDFLHRRSKKGFFMMIEGSQIDWGGHAGNTDYIITEMLDFDKAIGKVLDFAEKDGNTLVVVTADHETGGFSILRGSVMGQIKGGFGDPLDEKSKSHYHTGTMIPVFAYGPGAGRFTGVYENTAIFDKIMDLLELRR